MKIRVSLPGIMLGVCAAVSAQAQTLTPRGPYVAVTDRNTYPKPALPALGPAGSTITDPVFQSPITRLTDGATRPGFQNYSFRTTSSPHQNEWSAKGSYFYVISDDGTTIPFRFDAATGKASRINPTATGNGGLVLSTYVEPQFSYVDDSIIYVGYSGSGTNLHTIDQYDFSTGLYTALVNLETIVPGLSGTYIGGIASSAGSTERVETFFGGTSQDHHHYVLIFDRANPSNRVLLDTWASTINGQPTSVTLNFSLHHVAIDRSGRYVMLYTTAADQSGTRQAPQSYVWDTQTGSFFAMVKSVHPYGHDALGYGVSVNADCCTSTSWDAAQWQYRSLAAPGATRDMLPTVISPKEVYLADHTTWNNASSSAPVPYVSGTYRYGSLNTTPWRPLDDEIIAIETDAPGQNPTIWRFAHHRSDVSYDGNPSAEAFWYEPRPNISDDGRWVLFTSNWEKTLGTDPKGEAGTGFRQDVFLLKLTTTGTSTTTTTTNDSSQSVSSSTSSSSQSRQRVAASPHATAGDFTGDGRADLAMFRPAGAVWDIRNSIQTSFGQTGDIPVPGDYNGDRRVEMAVFRPSTGQWFISGRSPIQFGRPGDIPVPADYNGDGRTDVAVFRPSTGMWYVNGVASLGSVQFGRAGDIPVPADYDGDGRDDIAVFRPSTSTWYVNGVSTDASVAFGQAGDIPVPGDYEGTGLVQMTVFRPSSGQWVIRNGATIQFGAPGDVPMALDIDGDGRQEIVVFRRSTGMWYSDNVVTGSTTSQQFGRAGDVPLGARPGYRRQTATDFDADRRADIGSVDASAGWTVGSSAADFASASDSTFTFGAAGDVPVPADYDGDGAADRAVFRPSTGQWIITTSSSGFRATVTYQWGVTGDIPVPGDYDGDGKADVAVFRPSTGMWYYGESSSGADFTGSYGAQKFGISGDIPVPGDYDGDGRADIAVFRPSTGMWYYGCSSTNFASGGAIQWGLSTDIPVPGDYDGDGKTDVAVFRPSTGMWYLGASSTNFLSYQSIKWGMTGDTPVFGDFDGDGQADIAVFRPSTSTWYLGQSSTMFGASWTPVLGTSGGTIIQ